MPSIPIQPTVSVSASTQSRWKVFCFCVLLSPICTGDEVTLLRAHSFSVFEQAVVSKLIFALPPTSRDPQCPGHQRRVRRIKKRKTCDTLPCLFVDGISRLMSGRRWMPRKIKIYKVITCFRRNLQDVNQESTGEKNRTPHIVLVNLLVKVI